MLYCDSNGIFLWCLQRAMSDQRRVKLNSVSLQSSGKYRCEVSADHPSFHTESKSDEMLVVGESS